MELKYCLLRMVDPYGNHNKDYEMVQIDDYHFEARYGRVKSAKQRKLYSMSSWDKIYQQKLFKGYTDVTDTVRVTSVKSDGDGKYRPIEDDAVQKLIDELLRFANEFVKTTYSISKNEVTEDMVRKAEDIIGRLSKISDVNYFNTVLTELFTVVPRRMSEVSLYMAKSVSDFQDIIIRETQTLQALVSVLPTYTTTAAVKDQKDKRQTILEAFGLTIRECTEKEMQMIREKMAKSKKREDIARLIDTAYRIEQVNTESSFKNYMKKYAMTRRDIHFFYHGTRNENLWSIITKGFKLNPKAVKTGSMFGHASCYGAKNAEKSFKYTSFSGSYWAHGTSNIAYLFVVEFAYKNPWNIYSYPPDISRAYEKDIRAKGYDAVYAHEGASIINDEIMVYNEAAVIPRYLIRLKK